MTSQSSPIADWSFTPRVKLLGSRAIAGHAGEIGNHLPTLGCTPCALPCDQLVDLLATRVCRTRSTSRVLAKTCLCKTCKHVNENVSCQNTSRLAVAAGGRRHDKATAWRQACTAVQQGRPGCTAVHASCTLSASAAHSTGCQHLTTPVRGCEWF